MKANRRGEKSTKRERATRAQTPRAQSPHAPVRLGVVISREGASWRARVGGEALTCGCDPTVDPALVEEAMETGARVVLDMDADLMPTVVGVLATRRALTVSAEGDVDARVRRFVVSATDEARIQSPGAFVRAKGEEVEVFGVRVLTRARELARVMARMIKLN